MRKNSYFLFREILSFLKRQENKCFSKDEGMNTFATSCDLLIISSVAQEHILDEDIPSVSYDETVIIYWICTKEGTKFYQKTIRNYGLQVHYNGMVVEDFTKEEELPEYKLQSILDYLKD